MSLTHQEIVDQLFPHTESILFLLLKRNNESNNQSEINKIKFSLFHILDGYLSEDIGGVNSMQKYIIDNVLYDNSVYYIIEDDFHHSIYKLTHFLYYSNKKTAFLYFGTIGHASMLHIEKNEDSFDVTYINPGEGVIRNNVQNIKDETYCNMFNRMEVPNTHKLEFLMFIKVFIYFVYTPRINSNKLAELDFYYCIEESFKYTIPKLCLYDIQFEKLYNLYTNIEYTPIDDVLPTIENEFYKNEFTIEEEQYNIDIEDKLGDPNIIYQEDKEPMYFRLGDITIHKIIDHNNIPFNNAHINICGREYIIEDLYVPFKQNNVRLNNLYILNPILKQTLKNRPIEIKDILLNIVNFNTTYNIVFEPIKIDDLNFSYYNNNTNTNINVNINDLVVTCKADSITSISIINKNLMYENFESNHMKLNIPDTFDINRMQMFFIDDIYELSDWTRFMFNTLKRKYSNYQYLEAIFTKNKPQFGKKEQMLYDTSVRFMDMYNTKLSIQSLQSNITDNSLIKYYEAGLDIFKFHLDIQNKELLYKLQD